MVDYYLSIVSKFFNTPEVLLSPMDKLQILFAIVLPVAIIFLIYVCVVEVINHFKGKK